MKKKSNRPLKPPLNLIGSTVAGLGAPGLVLAVAMGTAASAGLTGAAVTTTALAAIGSGFGMPGGIAVLVVGGLLSAGFSYYSIEVVMKSVLKELKRRGFSRSQLLTQVEGYWISRGLKLKIREFVEELWTD